MAKLSKRMEAVASMVTTGNRLVDVGTDHGYIPIELASAGRIPSAIAADINEGPIARARENIRMEGLSDRIRTLRCDGLAQVLPGEADTILIAGMGGELVIHILMEGEAVCRSARELVLQPQSELHKVRRYLREHRYRIVDEDMVLEDGKYYPMMRAVPVEESVGWNLLDPSVTAACDLYGPVLLKNGNPILRRYLVKEHKQLETILQNLEDQPLTDSIEARKAEIREKIRTNESAYTILGEIVHAGI